MLRCAALFLAATSAVWANTAQLDGRSVYYEVSGKGEQSLVLIHGWTCNHTFWSGQIPAFSEHYRVVAVDLPGHGRSELAPDYSMERMARAVHAVMQKEDIPRATLIGHSMAGAVIVQFARLFPAALERVILVDALLLDAQQAKAFGEFARQFDAPDLGPLRRKMVGGMFSEVTPPEVKEKISREMLLPPDAVAGGAMKGMADPAAWEIVPSPVPALALLAPARAARAGFKPAFPNVTVRAMEKGGHFFMMETPEVFNQIVLEWLGAH